ncbi:MAG TPA: hypothetical protein VG603_01395 [Chitinophagales bacterium]|nr:hypothetical protein [Chitinophagales bacterium]
MDANLMQETKTANPEVLAKQARLLELATNFNREAAKVLGTTNITTSLMIEVPESVHQPWMDIILRNEPHVLVMIKDNSLPF